MTSKNATEGVPPRPHLPSPFDGQGRRHIDPEAQHTRNINWIFDGLIVVIVVVIVGGLLYGFWESNLKPVASVDGTDIKRSQLDDRKKLEDFRASRLQAQTTTALAAGEIDADLASTRLALADSCAPAPTTWWPRSWSASPSRSSSQHRKAWN